jgi:acid phosphatase (class A)
MLRKVYNLGTRGCARVAEICASFANAPKTGQVERHGVAPKSNGAARHRQVISAFGTPPCVEKLESDSYPSGHAQAAFMWAKIVGELFPERRAELLLRAHRVGWARVLGGVHYPTDVAVGYRLGAIMFEELKKSAGFAEAMERCRAEIERLTRKKAA